MPRRNCINRNIHGQSSLEYLIWIAPLILIVGILYANVSSDSVKTINTNMAGATVDSLAKAADTVHSLGPGSKMYSYISNPDGIQTPLITGNIINYKIRKKGNLYSDVVSPTTGEVLGYIPNISRSYKVPVKMLESGIIVVGWGLQIKPEKTYFTAPPGPLTPNIPLNLTNERLNLSNSAEDWITDIQCNITGEIENWTTTHTYPTELDPGETDQIVLIMNIPSGQPPGLYTGLHTCRNHNAITEATIIIEVPRAIQTATITTYNDPGYTFEVDEYNQTQTVYYQTEFRDQSNQLMAIDEFNLTINDSTNPVQNQTHLSTATGIHQDSYYIPLNASLGQYTIEVIANHDNGHTNQTITNNTNFTVYAHTGDGEECTPGNGSTLEESEIDDFEDYENQSELDKNWWEDDERNDPTAPCVDEACVPNEWRDYVCDDPSKECYDPNVITITQEGGTSHQSLRANYTFIQNGVKEYYTLEHYFWDDPSNQTIYDFQDWQGYESLHIELRAPTFTSSSDEVELHAGLIFKNPELFCQSAPNSECYNVCGCAPRIDVELLMCDGDGIPGNSNDPIIPNSCWNQISNDICICTRFYYFEEDINGKEKIEYLPPSDPQDTIQYFEWSLKDVDKDEKMFNPREAIGVILRFRETTKNSNPDNEDNDDSIYLDEVKLIPY
ncbi:hypothetical protein ACFLRC_04300 [Candidatus Altiarchaeota archaeon]